MTWRLATYCSADYLPCLENCLRGCARFLQVRPVVHAFDPETRRLAEAHGCEVVDIPRFDAERHLYSLEILRRGDADWTVLLDADCWPTRALDVADCLARAEAAQADFAGDVGQVDLAYLFKTSSREDLLGRLHETMRTFPRFAAAWGASRCVRPARPAFGDVVVDLPLLYGGFAAYRTASFRDVDYPPWIHSADIWLSMYAYEKGLRLLRLGEYQFNRDLQASAPFLHLAGPKSREALAEQLRRYDGWIRGTGA